MGVPELGSLRSDAPFRTEIMNRKKRDFLVARFFLYPNTVTDFIIDGVYQ